MEIILLVNFKYMPSGNTLVSFILITTGVSIVTLRSSSWPLYCKHVPFVQQSITRKHIQLRFCTDLTYFKQHAVDFLRLLYEAEGTAAALISKALPAW